ncbi:unnamed protein product [Schistocephalus solidus]|uniref:UBA domain-containing protein n=1 Tax=Schistocephalus solidus TaxID=70667 RepID=A0A3P7C0Y9_SCHSO|nr:unnamed protein product [Schistocephalus solidus]
MVHACRLTQTFTPFLHFVTFQFGVLVESTESNDDDEDGDAGEGGGANETPDAAVSAADAAQLANLITARPYAGPATSSRPGPARIDPQALHVALQQAAAAQQSTHAPRPTATTVSDSVLAAPTVTAMETDPPTAPPVDPAIRWASQLAIVAEMGITDTVTVIQALEATNGDVNLALQILFQ